MVNKDANHKAMLECIIITNTTRREQRSIQVEPITCFVFSVHDSVAGLVPELINRTALLWAGSLKRNS